jgi:hypothetical protein
MASGCATYPRHVWRVSPFWLKVVEVATLILALSTLGFRLGDQGSFPDWLEAISTLAAVLAAMYAGLYAANAWRLEVDREDRWNRQQQRQQASMVAAWPADLRPHVADRNGLGDETYAGFDGVNVMLRNASDVPVTRVWVEATLVVDIKSDHPLRLPLGEREVARILEPATEPIAKTVTAERPVDPSTLKPGGVEVEQWCEIVLSFRDAGGRDWMRLADGQLVLLQDATALEH